MSERVRIKVCGLTRREDVLGAVRLGVDYLGFVFVRHDPRAVDVHAAAEWLAELDTGQAKRVGVFQDEPATTVNDAVRRLRLDFVQLHGHEPRDYPRALDVPAIVVRRCAGNDAIVPLAPNVHAALLAPRTANGGSGNRDRNADLQRLLAGLPPGTRVILSGGLTAENVAAAVATYQPYAVDVTRGVEQATGIKALGRLRAFCAAVGRHV